MICPRCQGELLEVVKHGVTIDLCSECKGIWLDQGELGKVIAQMKQVESSLEAEFRPAYERRESYSGHHDDRRYDKHHNQQQFRKKSGFERLFEIFD